MNHQMPARPVPERGERRLYVCCRAVPAVPVPAAFSLARLAALVHQHRGRPVHVATTRSGPRWATAWLADAGSDWIVYRAVSRDERIRFAVHQAAHLLLGHQGLAVDAVMFTDLLFPALDRALGRGGAIVACGIATGAEDRQAAAVAGDLMWASAWGQGSRCPARKSTMT